MKRKDFIPIVQLCEHYSVEISFFDELHEEGLISITTLEQTSYLHQDKISDVEKMIRIHQELNINTEGIDAVFNLLNKIDSLQNELNTLHNRLRLYENDF
ncbi:chaperone modulator CbpM [uncultured Eudoraea sp.]|uniref:chaperone modulator CbpM n=1 Tax=uncultured Eudoraea sp. TaxID=1035614 RepID=UPI002631F0D6|nr:chaperone modulator CbpM [uncultured Eudoraea sp.]